MDFVIQVFDWRLVLVAAVQSLCEVSVLAVLRSLSEFLSPSINCSVCWCEFVCVCMCENVSVCACVSASRHVDMLWCMLKHAVYCKLHR